MKILRVRPNIRTQAPIWDFTCYAFLAILIGGGGYYLNSLWFDRIGELTEQQLNYDRSRAIAEYAKIPSLSHVVDQSAQLFLKEGTNAELTAALQAKLKELAANNGLQVASASTLKPKTDGALTLLGTDLQMSGSIGAVYTFVSQLESEKPYLFIDRLNMRSNDPPAGGLPSDSVLTVEIDVYGALNPSQHTTKVESPQG